MSEKPAKPAKSGAEKCITERNAALLQAAATLLPTYIDVASLAATKEGYDRYVRNEPRREAVREARALLEMIELED